MKLAQASFRPIALHRFPGAVASQFDTVANAPLPRIHKRPVRPVQKQKRDFSAPYSCTCMQCVCVIIHSEMSIHVFHQTCLPSVRFSCVICLCACVFVCMFTCKRMQIHTTCVTACIFACMCERMQVRKCMHACVCTRASMQVHHACLHVFACMLPCIYQQVHASLHVCLHEYACMCERAGLWMIVCVFAHMCAWVHVCMLYMSIYNNLEDGLQLFLAQGLSDQILYT